MSAPSSEAEQPTFNRQVDGSNPSERTIAQRLPSNIRLLTSVGGDRTRMELSITLENADQARALMVALETVMIPLFELTEAKDWQKPDGK